METLTPKNLFLKPINFLWSGLFLLILTVSCEGNRQLNYSVFIDFPKEGMIPGKDYIFYPFENADSLDNNDLYQIDLEIRYNQRCKILNLPLIVEYASLTDDSVKTLNLLINLFEEKKEFKKKGNFAISTVSETLIPDTHYQEGLFISVKTEEKETSGILSIGTVRKKIR